MNSKQLLLSLFAATVMTAACSKKSDNNTDAKIQQAINQTNADNKYEIEKIKTEFAQAQNEVDKITNEANRKADESLAALKKTTLNYVNKIIRVDVLDENGKVKNSYLDFFDLDVSSGSYKSKFETLMTNEGAGICINLASFVCETTFNFRQLAQKMGTLSAGRFKATQANEAIVSNMPEVTFKSTTKVTRLESDFMVLELTAKSTLGEDFPSTARTIKISTLGKLSQQKHNFFQLTADKSDRKDLSELDNDLKMLSLSTVQILINSNGESMLHGSDSGHGSGFFISDDGLMLTNNHVISGLTECMNFHKCKVILRQINQENKATVFTVDAQLLVTDVSMDFALLKISVPDEMKILKLEIEDNEVNSDLMTLGYPGDKSDSSENTPLTYSFGKLVGTLDLGYTTSVYIAGGASGSAMLNLANKKVVAIESNGVAGETGESESPGVARPIQMINAKFGIDDYLNGTKEMRITKILQMLKVSSNVSEAQKAIDAFENERTYLGLGVMKSIMLSHQDIAIRKLTMRYLEKRGFIMGPDED